MLRAYIGLESWDAQYRYKPVGAVGGDYCELVVLGEANRFFSPSAALREGRGGLIADDPPQCNIRKIPRVMNTEKNA